MLGKLNEQPINFKTRRETSLYKTENYFLSFEASVVINTEYLKLQREGAEHFLLSNKGRNLWVSVCIFIMSRTVHPRHVQN